MIYYNEFSEKPAAMLKQLMEDGFIPKGHIDTRSVADVRPEDLKGYTQCHFFAGIGGWPLALRLAGWPDDRPVWTGSCPCQPFSTAGKQQGSDDPRHLWPNWFELIRECRPTDIFGEQVSSAISHGWLDGVYADLEREGYALGSAVLPACSVDAPHKRDRLWFTAVQLANAPEQRLSGWRSTAFYESGSQQESERCGQNGDVSGPVGNPSVAICEREAGSVSSPKKRKRGARKQDGNIPHRSEHASGSVGDSEFAGSQGQHGHGGAEEGWEEQGRPTAASGFWSDHEWIMCGDGKARRIPSVESGIRLLAYGFPHRVPILHALGNAIVPEVAARFIKAVM